MNNQCWFGKMTGHPDDRCPEYGNWGWTKEAADKAQAAKGSIFRLARWCIKHKHPDDSYLGELDEKKELAARQQREGESKQKTRQDGDLSYD